MREENTGIVYQHVDATQMLGSLIYERPDRVRITKVPLNDHVAITGKRVQHLLSRTRVR